MGFGTQGFGFGGGGSGGGGSSWPIQEPKEIIPQFVGTSTGQNNRNAQDDFMAGGMFYIPQRITFDTVHLWSNSQSGVAPTLKLLIYQQADGRSGVADLVGSISGFAVPLVGSAAVVATIDEGLVTLEPGYFYVLWGQDNPGGAGGFSLQNYNTQSVRVLNDPAPVGTRPVTFDTTIDPTAAIPATFDPAEGGDAISDTLDTALIIRLERS